MLLRFPKILDERPRRRNTVFPPRNAVRRKGPGAELFEQILFRMPDVERPGNVTGKGRKQIMPHLAAVAGGENHVLVADDLRRGQLHELIENIVERGSARKFHRGKFPRRDVRPGDGDAVARFVQTGDIVVSAFVEHRVVDERPRGDHPHDVPFHQPPPRFLGIGKLLADGDLFPHRNEPGDISVRGMIGNAAHGRPLLEAAVLARQRQIEQGGNLLCVLEEHFIKIPETIEQNTVLVFFLHLEIVPHHL